MTTAIPAFPTHGQRGVGGGIQAEFALSHRIQKNCPVSAGCVAGPSGDFRRVGHRRRELDQRGMTVSWELKHSVVANADRQAVWEFVSNIDHLARIEGDAVEAVAIDGLCQAGTKDTTEMRG